MKVDFESLVEYLASKSSNLRIQAQLESNTDTRLHMLYMADRLDEDYIEAQLRNAMLDIVDTIEHYSMVPNTTTLTISHINDIVTLGSLCTKCPCEKDISSLFQKYDMSIEFTEKNYIVTLH